MVERPFRLKVILVGYDRNRLKQSVTAPIQSAGNVQLSIAYTAMKIVCVVVMFRLLLQFLLKNVCILSAYRHQCTARNGWRKCLRIPAIRLICNKNQEENCQHFISNKIIVFFLF